MEQTVNIDWNPYFLTPVLIHRVHTKFVLIAPSRALKTDFVHQSYRWTRHYCECAALTTKSICGDLTLVIYISLLVRINEPQVGPIYLTVPAFLGSRGEKTSDS